MTKYTKGEEKLVVIGHHYVPGEFMAVPETASLVPWMTKGKRCPSQNSTSHSTSMQAGSGVSR